MGLFLSFCVKFLVVFGVVSSENCVIEKVGLAGSALNPQLGAGAKDDKRSKEDVKRKSLMA